MTRAPLVACLLLALVLAYLVFRPFLLTFAVAASLAMLLAPAQERATLRLGGRPGLAAALIVVLCFVLVLAPVLSYGLIIANQASTVLDWLRPRLEPAAIERFTRETLPQRFPLAAEWLRSGSDDGGVGAVWSAARHLAGLAQDAARKLAAEAAEAVFDMILLLMMLFFLLRDGPLIREQVRGVSPLSREQEADLIDHLTRTVRGVLQSMVAVPVAQAAVALVGFLIFGVPAPLLWAVMVVFAALIPLLGSPLAWVPAGLFLLGQGHTGRGVGLLLYGVLVISMIDNILKPLILQGSAQIHTLLGFLSILGGVLAFGPKGVIVGPVVLSLVLSAYRIYRYDVLRWRSDLSLPPTAVPPP